MARKNRDSFGKKKKKKRGEERAVRASGWDEMENWRVHYCLELWERKTKREKEKEKVASHRWSTCRSSEALCAPFPVIETIYLSDYYVEMIILPYPIEWVWRHFKYQSIEINYCVGLKFQIYKQVRSKNLSSLIYEKLLFQCSLEITFIIWFELFEIFLRFLYIFIYIQ